MVSRKDAAAHNAAWLKQIQSTLLLAIQTEPSRALRGHYGAILAEAAYYQMQLDMLVYESEKRSRARRPRQEAASGADRASSDARQTPTH
jgi:hypothetical protein